jgi:hypothetical protein
MSRRRNAPYRDRIEDEGRVLIYEGHDVPRSPSNPDPKKVDQPRTTPAGKLTQNGMFAEAAGRTKKKLIGPELVAVYEKIYDGIWAFNGFFLLTDAWTETDANRRVFKFRLKLNEGTESSQDFPTKEILHNRLIPSAVKLEVWQRDGGKCVLCGSNENLHFDHDLPFSKGGSSLLAANIRLLCAKHNLSKGAKIE